MWSPYLCCSAGFTGAYCDELLPLAGCNLLYPVILWLVGGVMEGLIDTSMMMTGMHDEVHIVWFNTRDRQSL